MIPNFGFVCSFLVAQNNYYICMYVEPDFGVLYFVLIFFYLYSIEIINNKARHNLIDAKCRWRSDWLDSTGRFRESLG